MRPSRKQKPQPVVNSLNRITFIQHLKSKKNFAHLFASTELVEQRSSASNLPSSEAIKARIIAVIHPVVDRINTTTRARVLANRATRRSRALGGSVGDGVAGGRAAALEDVVEAQVVADFVDGGGALVEAGGGAAGDRVGKVDAAVEEEVGGGGVGDGEVAPVVVGFVRREFDSIEEDVSGMKTYHPRVPPGMSEAKYKSSSLYLPFLRADFIARSAEELISAAAHWALTVKSVDLRVKVMPMPE